jgi:hypothetical protein
MTRTNFFQMIAALFTGAAFKAKADSPGTLNEVLGKVARDVAMSDTLPSVRIFSRDEGVTKTAVEIDGVDVPRVRTIRFEHTAGQLPILTLECFPGINGIDLAAKAVVRRIEICPMCKVEMNEAMKRNQARLEGIAQLQSIP